MTEIGRDLPTTPQPQPSWRQQQHQGAPKLPGALPGLAISSADPGIGPELHHTPTPSGAPWKLWKSSSTYSDTSCSTAQRDASSSAPFLDFLSLPQVHLSSFNPLQLLSRPANGGPLSASSSSRQETPRPLDGSTLGAPFEESTGAQKYTSKPALEEQNLKLDEGSK